MEIDIYLQPLWETLAAVCGCGARAVLMCVYGNRAYEDTLVELADTAEKAGFHVIAAVAAIAEHSVVRRFAAGRPGAAGNTRGSSRAALLRAKGMRAVYLSHINK